MICIMATRRVEIGPTGETVRANVARVRKQRALTLRDVADRLTDIGHPMAHNTVSEIERGARRVDVDDLTALAVALGTSPIGLLLPHTDDKSDLVEVTGFEGDLTAEQLWKWLIYDDTLPQTPSLVRSVGAMFRLSEFAAILPSWVLEQKDQENMASLLQELREKGVRGFGDD